MAATTATTSRTAGPGRPPRTTSSMTSSGHPFDLRLSPSIDDVVDDVLAVGRSYPTEVLPCA